MSNSRLLVPPFGVPVIMAATGSSPAWNEVLFDLWVKRGSTKGSR